MITTPHALAALGLFALAAQEPARPTFRAPVRPQEPAGYAGNPSTLRTPLRQDVEAITFTARADGSYDVALVTAGEPIRVEAVDLEAFVPRVPLLARGDPALERLALFQREYNRNETGLGRAAGTDDLRLANNCLGQGLWEVMLSSTKDGKKALDFHGWFEFPDELYAELLGRATGRAVDPATGLFPDYPALDGVAVPFEMLRRVDAERAVAVEVHLDEPRAALPEQTRKAKLVLTPDVATYRALLAPERQPIRMASFREPGYYDAAKPVALDLAWLAHPRSAVVRDVTGGRVDVRMKEVEIAFENGWRLVLAHEGIASLPVRSEPPAADADVLRMTFGIATPEIYASAAERRAERADEPAGYLFLLDGERANLDNHCKTTDRPRGVDRAFLWRDAERLHVWLVSYERIAIVAHLSLSWPSF